MLRRCAVLLIVGLVPVLSGCPAPGGGDWQAQMLRSINTIRAGAGVGPVSLCGTLGAAAQQHSEDQAGRSTMSHSGAAKASPTQFMIVGVPATQPPP